ncbi:MAG TPA: hypothetical protein VIA98_12375 [Allosphingosinicella sp.]|jgi:uncharacterized repeat protein (TIGR01451 family)
MKIILFMLALIAPVAALAANDVALQSEVLVEKIVKDAQGAAKTVREVPKVVTPGDSLVFLLSYKNQGAEPATGFTVTNPVPPAVAFASVEGAGAEVSVDGGKTWGQLAALKVAATDGTSRAAAAADVTHVRWTFAQPIAAGKSGTLSFHGTVK